MKTAACGPVTSPQLMTKDNSLFVVKRVKFCGVSENALICEEGTA